MRLKRLLAVTLAVTMVMASSLTAGATSSDSDSGSGGSGGASSSSSSSSSSSESSYSVSLTSYEKAVLNGTTKAGGSSKIAGINVPTSAETVVVSDSIQGVACISTTDMLNATLGLKDGAKAKLTFFDTDTKKSYNAMKCVNAAAQMLGGTVVSALDVDLYATKNGKKLTLTDGSVFAMVGLPKNVDLTKSYSVVYVQAGGKISILPVYTFTDFPGTITFQVNVGQGVYAIVAK